METLAVIPARYASTRLPGKPLLEIAGKTLIRRVYEGAASSSEIREVVVATDDERIAEEVRRFGGRVEMTSPDHESGTDRVAEVARRIEADVILNVQGDLPFVSESLIDPPLRAIAGDSSILMATACVPIVDREAWLDPNVVKVVRDDSGSALYFSRAAIPSGDVPPGASFGWQHIGLYAYRRDVLERFTGWPPSSLERRERLEQLRALERGLRIFVAPVEGRVLEVNTPDDLDRAMAETGTGEGG